MLEGYKTYIGIIFTLLGTLATAKGWSWGSALPELQGYVVTIVGALIAIYGRAVAKPTA